MPKVFDILKTRWAEVLLLVGFQTGVLLLMEQIMALAQAQAEGKPVTMPPLIAFLLGLGTMAFFIVWQMLRLGFLRTAYTDGCTQWEPGPLLGIGRVFFWRILRFEILLGLVLAGLTAVLTQIIAAALPATTADKAVPLWVEPTAAFLMALVLIKYAVLMPALMVGRDLMVRDSYGALRTYRLAEAAGAAVYYILMLTVALVISIAVEWTQAEGLRWYLLLGGYGLASGILGLIMHLEALRTVAAREKIKVSDTFSEAPHSDNP